MAESGVRHTKYQTNERGVICSMSETVKYGRISPPVFFAFNGPSGIGSAASQNGLGLGSVAISWGDSIADTDTMTPGKCDERFGSSLDEPHGIAEDLDCVRSCVWATQGQHR